MFFPGIRFACDDRVGLAGYFRLRGISRVRLARCVVVHIVDSVRFSGAGHSVSPCGGKRRLAFERRGQIVNPQRFERSGKGNMKRSSGESACDLKDRSHESGSRNRERTWPFPILFHPNIIFNVRIGEPSKWIQSYLADLAFSKIKYSLKIAVAVKPDFFVPSYYRRFFIDHFCVRH